MADDQEPIEARPVESGPPSDLMTAVLAGVNNAAVTAQEAAATGKALDETLTGLEAKIDRATRRRTLLVAVGLAVGVLVVAVGLTVVVLFARLADVIEKEDAGLRALVECTTPSPPPGEELDDEDRVHECADRNAANLADALRRIDERNIDVSTAAVECARERAPDLAACIDERVRPRG